MSDLWHQLLDYYPLLVATVQQASIIEHLIETTSHTFGLYHTRPANADPLPEPISYLTIHEAVHRVERERLMNLPQQLQITLRDIGFFCS